MRSFVLSPLLLLFAFPLCAQEPASAPTAGNGGVQLSGTYPVVFRLHDAAYALAIEGAVPREVPSGEEKLLVIEFEVENTGTRSYGLSDSTVRLAAIDQDERFGEAVYDKKTDYRLAGTTRTGRGTFGPGQTRRLYTAFFVAAGSSIDALELAVTGGEAVRLPLAGRIRELPAPLTDAEGRVPDLIPARPGPSYVVGAYDLAVEPMTRVSNNDEEDSLLVPITVRNRAPNSVPLSRGLIDAYVADDDGERHKLTDLLKGSEDRATGLSLAPDQTVTARLQFAVPKSFQPSTLMLSSSSGRAEGHRYQFDLDEASAGASRGVLGKYVPGQISSPGQETAATRPSAGADASEGAAPASTGDSDAPSQADSRIATVPSAPTVNLEEAARQREAEILGRSSTSESDGGTTAATSGGTPVIGSAPSPQIGGTRDIPTTGSGSSSTSGDLTVMQEDRTLADEGTVQLAPLPVSVSPITRDGLINFRRLTVVGPVAGSGGGDSPYIYTYWFRGRLGEADGSPTIFVFDRQIHYFGGYEIPALEDWARKGAARDIPASAGRSDFPALKPYEIYGGVMVIMDWEPGSSELRRARASAINAVLNNRWNRVISGTENFDFTRRDATSAQTIVDQSLARLNREFLNQLSEAVRTEAARNRDNAAEQNEDRYVDTVACFWINLPATDAPNLQPDAVKTRLVQALGGATQAHWASEYVRPPGDHQLTAYQNREGNLRIGYLSRMAGAYHISTGLELASP